MKLICPSCGAVHSAEAWENDAAARDTIVALNSLPEKVRPHSLSYLAMFRSKDRALQWKRAVRVLADLLTMVGASDVEWKGSRRPVRLEHWADGLQVVAAKSDLARPLENHNYLRHVVYGLAEREMAKKEAEAEEAKRYQYKPIDQGGNSQPEPVVSAAEYKRRHGVESLADRVGKRL